MQLSSGCAVYALSLWWHGNWTHRFGAEDPTRLLGQTKQMCFLVKFFQHVKFSLLLVRWG